MNLLFSFTAFVIGLLLVVIILYKNKQVTAKLLAFFIFTIAYNNLMSFLWESRDIMSFPFLLRTGPLVAYLRGPCLFFYILLLLDGRRRLKFTDAWHLIPALIYFIDYLPLFLSYEEYKLSVIDQLFQTYNQRTLFAEGWISLLPKHIWLKSIVTIIYLFLLAGIWKKYKIPTSLLHNRQLVNWMKIVTAVFAIDSIFGIITGFYPSSVLVWTTTVFHLLSYCGVIIIGLFFLPDVLYGTGKTSNAEPIVDKLKYTGPSEETSNLVKDRMMEFLDQKGFLQKQIKLAELANIIGVQPYVLSAYINHVYHMRFNDFINFYRIQYVSDGLLKGEWEELTLEAIGEKAGFTNRTTFLNSFKRYKGTTPTLFLAQQKLIKKQNGLPPHL